MNDSSGMRFRERIGDLDSIFQCFIQTQSLAPYHLVQRLARDVLHRDELDSVRFRDVVDVNNVGMVESGCCLGLLYEPPLSFRISNFLGGQNLNGHEPVQVRIPGLVHDTHAAAPKGFEDLVMLEGTSDHGATRICDTCESNCIAGASAADQSRRLFSLSSTRTVALFDCLRSESFLINQTDY